MFKYLKKCKQIKINKGKSGSDCGGSRGSGDTGSGSGSGSFGTTVIFSNTWESTTGPFLLYENRTTTNNNLQPTLRK